MNILMCSVGRRGELLKDFRKSMGDTGNLIATDNSPYAPALYLADKSYRVPLISDSSYIHTLLEICLKERVQAVATFIDPEIELLAKHRDEFEQAGVLLLTPCAESAALCFDKFKLYQHMKSNGIPTVNTYGSLQDAQAALKAGQLSFPVFVKPRTGSGSVGARKVQNMDDLVVAFEADPTLIAQEYMDGIDLDADIYVDTLSHQVVSAFSKKKISTTIGGANKTISFKDQKLFDLIQKIASVLELNGPNDMDFFYKNGEYFLSEINPRFGGAYLHAYGSGVDFIKLIENNVNGQVNSPCLGNYEEGVVMMMYDSVVIKRPNELLL